MIGNGNGNGHNDPFGQGGFNVPPEFDDNEPPVPDHDFKTWNFDNFPTMSWWAQQNLPPRDLLLGEVLATDTRMLLIGKTGLGKTNFGLAFAIAVATGTDFLHWQCPRQSRVLYIDGELSPRLMKRWLDDAGRRHGCLTDNLMVLSAALHPNMPPLNTPEGQNYIDQFLLFIGPVDLVIFDNVQALIPGNQRETDAWTPTLGWQRELTNRNMGQVWMHHANDDDTMYGDKTRSWQMDVVAIMREAQSPRGGKNLAFNLTFDRAIGGKARERTPENRADFEDALIYLEGDQWFSDRGVARPASTKHRRAEEYALDMLKNALAEVGTPVYLPKIPPEQVVVTVDMWQRYFKQNYVGEVKPESIERTFRKHATTLQNDSKVRIESGHCWALT